jgi:hypothetical protein
MQKILIGTAVAVTALASLALPAIAFAAGPPTVNLLSAGNYTILAKTAVTTTGVTVVTGDIGISPALSTNTSGFALVLDGTGTFSTSASVVGKIYAADYTAPTPATLSTAVSAMEAAYTDAATRTPGTGATNLNLGGGTLNGQNLVPGTFTWGSDVSITGDITLTGTAADIWIMQISGNLSIDANKKIILAGGAKSSNIFWQVAGTTTVNPGATFSGIILAGPGASTIAFQNGAILDGRALGQTDVTLIGNTISAPIISTEPPVPTMLKVHILKYLDGQQASVVPGNYLFPMTATWQTANLNGGVSTTGLYTLGSNWGGASDLYGADTAAMQSPADYSTAEVTTGTSNVLPTTAQCAQGKYRLQGYKMSPISFADAALQATTTSAVFVGLIADKYVLVYNETCTTATSTDSTATTTATVVATKVVCTDEADLPNWGTGGPNITATTASDWIASHESCRLADGWSFEWGNQSAGDLGRDFVGPAGSGYTTFGSTVAGVVSTTIPLSALNGGSEFHLREVLQNGYIPFTFDQSHQSNADNVSAEFYCSDDVLNYDNYDFIRSPEAGTTYYCVGFNAPVPAPACNPEASQTVVSDTSTTDTTDSHAAVLLSTIHAAWTALSGASWIWSDNPVVTPDVDETKVFTRTFSIVGMPLTGSLDIAADNHYIVKVNGTEVANPAEPEFNYGASTNYNITSNLVSGTNTLEFTVKNIGIASSSADANPAGLLYRLNVTNNECQVPPTDLCPNIGGVQTVVPEGLVVNSDGQCVEPTPPPTDLCPNIEGTQTVVPEGLVVNSDGQCVDSTPADPECTVNQHLDNHVCVDDTPVTPTITRHSGGGGGGSACKPGFAYSPDARGCIQVGQVRGASTGEVLGASCGIYMDKHIKFGSPKNDSTQVTKLQAFLNKWMGTTLPASGVYDKATLAALNAFQVKYSDQILKPWGISAPTGLVYLSTIRQINLLECPDLSLELPRLVDWNKNPNAQ